MKTKGWNPVILMGIVLGASVGGIAAIILLRRSRQRATLGARDIPWRDLIKLSAPILALARRLIELTRGQPPEFDIQ